MLFLQHDKHDADVKMFEKKVAEVKEWVIQIVGQVMSFQTNNTELRKLKQN